MIYLLYKYYIQQTQSQRKGFTERISIVFPSQFCVEGNKNGDEEMYNELILREKKGKKI